MHGISILVKCTVYTYKSAIFNLNNLNTYKSKNLKFSINNFQLTRKTHGSMDVCLKC